MHPASASSEPETVTDIVKRVIKVDDGAMDDLIGPPSPTDMPGLRTLVAAHRGPGDGHGTAVIRSRLRRLEAGGSRTVIDVPSLADDEMAVDVAVSAGRVVLVVKSGVTDGEAADRLIRRLVARGVDVVDLGIGDPDQPTPDALIHVMTAALADPACHPTDRPPWLDGP